MDVPDERTARDPGDWYPDQVGLQGRRVDEVRPQPAHEEAKSHGEGQSAGRVAGGSPRRATGGVPISSRERTEGEDFHTVTMIAQFRGQRTFREQDRVRFDVVR